MIAILAIGFDVATLDAGSNVLGAILGISLVALIGTRALLRAGGDQRLRVAQRIDRATIPLGLAFLVLTGLRIVLALGA